ncbi:MAG: tRNA pseudouridine(38-40) synthase TruA [Dehalococcoidales bacterium]|nr:tRNA pseudouridine(38-40) synthase TruA [Dehalococcoidales bacterium]
MAETTKILLVMEYDGTRYHGFQWQDGLPSIQGELEKALTRLTGERRRVISASRTDAGVHARGQVVSFRTGSALSTHSFVGGLNHYLPTDIAVKAAYRINDAFNVRREAISREYSYYILNRPTRSPIREGFAYLVAGKLDIEAMNQACLALVGEHDFASFAGRNGASVKSTVRRVFRAVVEREGELVIFNIAASSFLLHQVRNTVGALIRVGLGKVTLDEFNSIIEARELALAGPTAPAYGLCLNRVNYPGPLENYDENL